MVVVPNNTPKHEITQELCARANWCLNVLGDDQRIIINYRTRPGLLCLPTARNIPPKSGNRPKSSLIDSKFGTEVEEDVKKIFLEDQAQKIKGTLRI